MRLSCDLCILGAGAAGLSLAAGASQMGADTILVEKGRMGGDCLNYGCVPSKALIAAARHAHVMRSGAAFGIEAAEPLVSYGGAMAHVRQAIATIAPHDSQERFEGLGVRVLREHARFVSPREVRAGAATITARRFVIATGSSPHVPALPGLENVPFLTNETLWELRERPDHLLILGGGPIGMEMAQAHRRLGAKVTVIEAVRCLGGEDREAADLVTAALREEGVELREGQSVTGVERDGDGIAVLTATGRIAGSHLLIATGRRANLADLGLDAAGVIHDGRGVTVGSSLRSSNRRVYAIGDAAGGPQLTHLASYHASVVIRSILLGLPSRARSAHIPRATYTDPELAQIGPTEADARAEYGNRLEICRFDYAGNDRAVADNARTGFAKVMVVRGRPVGATIVGSAAGDLVSVWALAIASGLKMTAIAGMVAPYPTLGEINKRVAGAYFSPRLFDNPMVKHVVRGVQRLLP